MFGWLEFWSQSGKITVKKDKPANTRERENIRHWVYLDTLMPMVARDSYAKGIISM